LPAASTIVAGLLQEAGTLQRAAGVEEDLVVAVLAVEGALHVGGELVRLAAVDRRAVSVGQGFELVGVAAGEDRVGHQRQVGADLDAALGSDRGDRADQVLVGAHAAGDAVHDDADSALFHGGPRSFFGGGRVGTCGLRVSRVPESQC